MPDIHDEVIAMQEQITDLQTTLEQKSVQLENLAHLHSQLLDLLQIKIPANDQARLNLIISGD